MIPLSRPYFKGHEFNAIKEVLDSEWVMQGPKVLMFEHIFANYLEIPQQNVVAVSNGTAALELCLRAFGVGPGDFVLTVSHSFIATANAIRSIGAIPVFIDIAKNSLNMDLNLLVQTLENDFVYDGQDIFLREAIPLIKYPGTEFKNIIPTRRLAAILVVHQLGTTIDLDFLLKIKNNFKIPIIEDAACAIGSHSILKGFNVKIGSNYLDASTFSFHPRKVLTMGEGGMITSPHLEKIERIRLIRSHGQKYDEAIQDHAYPICGFNYRLTDIQAALGIEQVKLLPELLERRRNIFKYYLELFETLNMFKIFLPQKIDSWNIQSFVVELAPTINQNNLLTYLKQKGIASKIVCMNAHEEQSYCNQPLPYNLENSELSKRNRILLPFFTQITRSEIEQVIEALKIYEKQH